jgi:hypothetical protein
MIYTAAFLVVAATVATLAGLALAGPEAAYRAGRPARLKGAARQAPPGAWLDDGEDLGPWRD